MERPQKGGIRRETFPRGFGRVSEVAFAMYGNPTKVFSTDNSPQLTYCFT